MKTLELAVRVTKPNGLMLLPGSCSQGLYVDTTGALHLMGDADQLDLLFKVTGTRFLPWLVYQSTASK